MLTFGRLLPLETKSAASECDWHPRVGIDLLSECCTIYYNEDFKFRILKNYCKLSLDLDTEEISILEDLHLVVPEAFEPLAMPTFQNEYTHCIYMENCNVTAP